jgi:predicted Zn-dependent peptidase
VARTLATNWINGLPPEALGQFVTKVNAVTADDVHRLGRSVFPSNHQTVVVVGDSSKIAAEVAQFGTVVELSSSSSQ